MVVVPKAITHIQIARYHDLFLQCTNFLIALAYKLMSTLKINIYANFPIFTGLIV